MSTAYPGPLAAAIDLQLDTWAKAQLSERIWARDTSVWSDRPQKELDNRLGWLDLPYGRYAENATALAAALCDHVREVILVGMGGSSLAPEVFAAAMRHTRPLRIADSTHPDAVWALLANYDPAATLVIVSSKSGTTAETRALADTLAARAAAAGSGTNMRFLAITDAGSALADTAAHWRGLALAPADVGGRFSALGPFGLIPAACAGIDVTALAAAGRHSADACKAARSDALQLGAWLAAAHAAGRNKLCLVGDARGSTLLPWIEQLVSESLGKDGNGLVPIAAAHELGTAALGSDAVWIALMAADPDPTLKVACATAASAGVPVWYRPLARPADVAAEMFAWEFAVAAAASALAVHPFDQPDVEAAKHLARAALTGATTAAPPLLTVNDAAAQIAAAVRPRDYIAVTAFLAPNAQMHAALTDLRRALAARYQRPVSVGFGPRFLHSTGQLHKGGSNEVVVLQLVDTPTHDVVIPGQAYGFATLIRAQADGDAAALQERGRRIVRVHLGSNPCAALATLTSTLRCGA